jgi:hypothetical protein
MRRIKQKRHGRGPAKFTKTSVTRGAKAVLAAGLPVSRVEIDPHTGKIAVIVREPAGDNDTPESIIKCKGGNDGEV